MENYTLFLLIAIVTVASPGPGVVLTITNSVRYGASGAAPGILGIAAATFVVAGVSATSLGVLLATSVLAFSILKFIGAAYLIYLGLKLWFSSAVGIGQIATTNKGSAMRFLEGFTLQLTNPKAVFFFMAVFPQFVGLSSPYIGQFLLLVATYSCLVVVIHLVYANSANLARVWLDTGKGAKIVSRVGGGSFICFGAGLAATGR